MKQKTAVTLTNTWQNSQSSASAAMWLTVLLLAGKTILVGVKQMNRKKETGRDSEV